MKLNDSAAGKAATIEKAIEEVLGVTPKRDNQYDRLKIRSDDRVQSRIDKNTAPSHMVDRYAHQMGEFEFPPIIVTTDGIIVDGNTRHRARAQRQERYIDVLIVPIEWDHADKATRDSLLYLSELINNMNGLPLGPEEREKMVMTMLDRDAPDEEIVNKVGMSLKEVSELRDQHRAASRLKSVGIDSEHFDDRALRAFGKAKVMRLNDESYRGLADLAKDAGLKANELKAVAGSIDSLKSAELQRDALARERQSREADITARRAGQEQPNLAYQLRGKLKFLLDHPIAAFVERNPERVVEYVELIGKAIDVLEQIRSEMPMAAAASSSETAEMRQ
jgi:hypothetical protein